MKQPVRVASLLVVIAFLLFAAAQNPSEAACFGNPLIQTRIGPHFTAQTASFVWTQDHFDPHYGVYYGYVLPPWSDTPPFTAALEATFWALNYGEGNHARGYTVPPYQWVYYNQTYYGGNYYAAEIFTGWGVSWRIQGCIQNTPPGNCTCVLLTDQDGVDGYFALVSGPAETGTWQTLLNQPGSDPAGNFLPIILKPIQAPTIIDAVYEPISSDMQVTVIVDPTTSGVYNASGQCGDCGPSGYKVLAQVVPYGSAPPADRSASAWTELPLAGGGVQGVAPFGSAVTLEIPACPADSYVWLATELHFDSEFVSSVVSANSPLLECSIPVLEVDIDIIPGSLNPRSTGTIPVALLGSEEFNVADVDVATLRFGPDEPAPAHDLTDTWTYNDHLQDVNLDGFMDLMTHFPMQETGIACGFTSATLTGSLVTGHDFEGSDSFRTVGCRNKLPVNSRLEKHQRPTPLGNDGPVDVSFDKKE